MKKCLTVLLVVLTLTMLLTGCVEPKPSKSAPSNLYGVSSGESTSSGLHGVSSVESTSSNLHGTSSGESASSNLQGASSGESMSNPLGFDPANPKGWSAYDDWDSWVNWMTNKKFFLTADEYRIENFRFGMTLDDTAKYFPSDPLSENEEVEDLIAHRILEFNSLKLDFIKAENDSDFVLFAIEVTGPKYTTPRGLSVGNDFQTVYKLYGVPTNVNSNIWIFGSQEYQLLYVTVTDGVVKKISFQGIL